MEKSIITTGKTIDLAVAAALQQLALDRDSVSVEVLEQAKAGFLGIGASPAKVKVTYEAPDEQPAPPAPALSSASRSKPKKTAPVIPNFAPIPAPTAQTKTEKQPEQPKPQQKQPRQQPKQQQKQPKQQPKPERKAAPVTFAPAEPGSTEEKIEVFIKGLLEHMGSDAVPHAVKTAADTYSVDLIGENLGMLIGRRGDTLDAIQHLTNYTINRDANKRARISVDAENYRKKREESLQRLAVKVAGKVLKYRRNITLEPMNAYERHVIHAALQDTEGVTTFSTGTEPNRRIVVAYSRDKAAPEAYEEEE